MADINRNARPTSSESADSTLAEAQRALNEAQRWQPRQLAENYINNELTQRPVDLAQARLSEAQQQLAHLQEIDTGLRQELDLSEGILIDRQRRCTQALAHVILNSPEFLALYSELPQAWERLRSLRVCLSLILTACGGNAPSEIYSVVGALQPLDADYTGYPVDQHLLDRWQTALAALRRDADADLP